MGPIAITRTVDPSPEFGGSDELWLHLVTDDPENAARWTILTVRKLPSAPAGHLHL